MNVNEVRSREHLGIVTSETSTSNFSFFVTPLKNRSGLVEGDFVVVDHPSFGDSCPVVGTVNKICNFEEVVGTTLLEKSVQTVATAEVLGFVDLRNDALRLKRLVEPPHPGSKVFTTYLEFLEEVFLRDPEGVKFEHPLQLGSLEANALTQKGESKPLGFYLDAADFAGQHFLIAGMTGMGKTHAAAVIVEELANKTSFPIVVLDSFGEYNTIGFSSKQFEEPGKAKGVMMGIHPFEYSVTVFAKEPKVLKSKLEKKLGSLQKTDKFVIKAFSENQQDNLDQKSMDSFIDELKSSMKSSTVLVLDGSGLNSEERRKLYSIHVNALLNGLVNGSVNPFVLVVEEPEALEPELLERVASEGRKIGVSMCLLSQHPSEIGGKVLSQIGNYLLGRMIENQDIDCVKTVAVNNSALLPTLRKGEFLISGINIPRNQKVTVRQRYSISR